ncbi:autotransporter domain-containing protein [Psychrobacter sanguinis]|uniref:autotransporter domain-containing protein n=1 Tax=Psychrobacter sanguinis TaxID=861445 RepID=UPI00020C7E58|nr:autotransporter domain-containing protein [Psychrobacter sanguinis]EGK12612.1 outer membrane autotransporter barrel [Psychrobacter sp. 1501(2011)]MCD9151850.1 autotransporter domain-containing protein [Psychrobacter sanguinis]HBH33390.1 autotransporter domain-containing protein [Psychrobacter sp.]
MFANYSKTPSCAKNRTYTPSLKMLSKAILAITLSSVGVAHASDYSSVTFFGDSLTDGGYFKKATEALGHPQSGQYTTNPDNTWATPFAESLGLNSVQNTYDEATGQQTTTGNNYAIGGARSGIDLQHDKYEDTTGKPLPVYSTRSQVDRYLADKNIDSKGLYTVWTGANDLFAVVSDVPNASNIISSAVSDEVATVKKLHDNGANYIVVPNIPDVGLTPNFVGTPLATFGTDLVKQYNEALYSGVKNTGANVIPLDTFSLVQQVAANPTAYGFSNVTDKACKDSSSVECGRADLDKPGAENSYFFADGVHPTGRAHRMIADYANAVVTAPSQVSVLPHIATQSGLATNERLQTHINQRQNQNHTLQSMSPEGWVSANINSLDVAGFESNGNAQLLLGLDFAHSSLPNAMTGVYANLSQSELDSSKRTGLDKVDFDELGLGLYHSHNLGKVQLNGALGYSTIDMEINRKVSLDNYTRNYKSDVDGSRYYASLQAGYPMQMANMAQFTNTTITPYLGATANRVKLDAIKEGAADDPIAMQFDEQKYNTVYGTLGVKANSRLSNNLNVFGDVHYQKQLDDNHKEVTARVNTLSDMSFRAPKASLDDDSFGASLGLSRQFKSFLGSAGVSYASGDDDDITSVFIELVK